MKAAAPARAEVTATFGARYCAARRIAPERYLSTLLPECLPPLARVLWRFLPGSYFAADRELLLRVAELHRWRDYYADAEDFHQHPDNLHWLRHHVRLRVSTTRLRRVLRATLEPV